MKQFWTILQFELKSYFKNKIFIGVTLFLVALIGIVMLFPAFPHWRIYKRRRNCLSAP